MKILFKSIFIVLIALSISKINAAEVNTKELQNQLQALVNLSDSLKDASQQVRQVSAEAAKYDQEIYEGFTRDREREVIPYLNELIKKINAAQQERTPITKQVVVGWYRDYRKIMERYDKIAGRYFGKQYKSKNKEFNNKEFGLNESIYNLLELRKDMRQNIESLFKSAVEIESQEAKQKAAEEQE